MITATLRIIDRVISIIETTLLSLSLLVMAGALFAQILLGFAGISLTWAGELSLYLMVWVMCIGACAATRQSKHISINIISDRLKPGARRVLNIAVYAFCVATALGFCKLGINYVLLARGLGQTSMSLNIPLWVVYSALPASAVLMAMRFLILLAGEFGFKAAAQEDKS
ncbi:MAG TPA: TRAP transporter small permease [bacterium]|nr:TRAP transporter small permease [bacterium]